MNRAEEANSNSSARTEPAPSRARKLALAGALVVVVILAGAIGIALSASRVDHGAGSAGRVVPAPSCPNTESTVRELFAKYPVAHDIDQAGARLLRADLQAIDRSCSSNAARIFQTQELDSWLNSTAAGK